MRKPKIVIKEPETYGEYRYIEMIQKDAWGANEIDITPTHVCVATHLSGGCVYIAYMDSKPVGFVLGFIGVENGQIFLHSHQLGVIREAQNKNIGFLLKLKQREYAQRLGINTIKWTFDPLQSKNAYFNFNKLGVICRKYIVNLYGEIRDEINRGMPSDRFYVEWYIDSDRVKRRIKGERPPIFEKISSFPIATCVKSSGGIKRLENYDIIDENFVLIEIPKNFSSIRDASLEIALDWRFKTRKIFLEYFRKGYIVIDLITNSRKDRFFYVLTKIDLKTLLRKDWWRIT